MALPPTTLMFASGQERPTGLGVSATWNRRVGIAGGDGVWSRGTDRRPGGLRQEGATRRLLDARALSAGAEHELIDRVATRPCDEQRDEAAEIEERELSVAGA